MMNSSFCSFLKGVGTGAVLGMAVVVTCKMMTDGNMKCMKVKNLRKKMSYAARNAGCIMDNVAHILK